MKLIRGGPELPEGSMTVPEAPNSEVSRVTPSGVGVLK